MYNIASFILTIHSSFITTTSFGTETRVMGYAQLRAEDVLSKQKVVFQMPHSFSSSCAKR